MLRITYTCNVSKKDLLTWHRIHGPARYLLGWDADDLLCLPLSVLSPKETTDLLSLLS